MKATKSDNKPFAFEAFRVETIAYSDYQNIDGALIPFKQTVFNGDFGDADAYLHKLTVESFSFDAVEVSALRPNAGLSVVGDEKP